jgi:TolB-like protein/Tfp pilus assembly protein PilF
VLYEMVAGCLPFAGSTSSEVLASILSEKEPQPLARYSREVPAELERIVSKALRKKREERYQTIKDFLLDLKSLKQELEFAAKLERSTPPELSGAGGASKRTHPQPASTGPGDTGQTAVEGPRATLNADLIVRRIKRHRVGTLLALVTLGAVAAAVVYLAYSRKAGEGGSGAIRSIAVLPFTNADGNPDAEYLSDGISESLINSLSQLAGIKVIARSSSFAYKGKEAEPHEVAKALGVEAILTGRVMQRGDNLLISAELVNASDMTHVWGGQYRRQAADALAVQEEIAREISEKLQVKLTAQEQERLVKRHTENIEAYEAYLKGRYFWSKRTVEDFKKSIEYFRQAIEKDPRYALAYTGLADSYILLGTYHVLPPAEAISKARLATMKALEIDDELAEAHISLATIEGELEWNWSIAEKEFKQAIKLNPNYATAHQWYGEYLVVMGRFDEALAEIKRAHQLDPLSLVVNLALGDVFYYSRRYDEAIEQYRKTVEIDSDFGYAYAWLGRAYLQKGLYAEAIAKLEKARGLSGGEPLIAAWLGYALALAGEKDKARDMLDELKERSKREYISPYYLAIIYAGLADKDQAFEYLEKAYAERSNWVLRLKAEPKFDSLRSDQKFADLLRRVGLPQ